MGLTSEEAGEKFPFNAFSELHRTIEGAIPFVKELEQQARHDRELLDLAELHIKGLEEKQPDQPNYPDLREAVKQLSRELEYEKDRAAQYEAQNITLEVENRRLTEETNAPRLRARIKELQREKEEERRNHSRTRSELSEARDRYINKLKEPLQEKEYRKQEIRDWAEENLDVSDGEGGFQFQERNPGDPTIEEVHQARIDLGLSEYTGTLTQ